MRFQLNVRENRAAKQTITAAMPTMTKIEKRFIRGIDWRGRGLARQVSADVGGVLRRGPIAGQTSESHTT